MSDPLYPAKWLVQTAQGPEPCCTRHANALEKIMRIMGSHTSREPATDPIECNNCRNEAANKR